MKVPKNINFGEIVEGVQASYNDTTLSDPKVAVQEMSYRMTEFSFPTRSQVWLKTDPHF